MKKLGRKPVINIFVTFIAVLYLLTTQKAEASIFTKLWDMAPTPSHLANWGEDFIIGMFDQTIGRPLIGCPISDLTGATSDSDQQAKIDACIGSSTLGKMGTTALAVPPSLLGVATSLTIEAPTRSDIYPVNLALYVNDVKKDSLVAPQPAYATLSDVFLNSTILALWKAIRNLAYLFFVVILVAIGFMVMFRYKINPQTVITVQSSLPKIVVGLLLITFSYPIGALAINLIAALNQFAQSIYLFPAGGTNVVILVIARVLLVILSIVGLIIGTGGAATPLAIFVVIMTVVMLLAILLAIISIAVSYFTRIARIILMTAFAPLQFALGSLPGKGELISGWFKALLANILAIPAMYLLLTIGINIIIAGPIASAGAATDLMSKIAFGFIGLFVDFLIGIWFIWQARNAPKWIEGALGIGGGWVPGKPPKAGGKK